MKTSHFIRATVVSLLIVSRVVGEEPLQNPLHLYCQDCPAKNSWGKVTSDTFDGAVKSRRLHHEIDEQGEGVLWGWAHWLEVEGRPYTTQQASANEEFHFRPLAHLLIFREFWTYERDTNGKLRKKEWVRRTVCHLKAGDAEDKISAIRVNGSRKSNGGYKKEIFHGAAHSNQNGAEPVTWKGKTIGWASVAWASKDANNGNGVRLETAYRWFTPSQKQFASSKENVLRLDKPVYTKNGGQFGLQWNFAFFESFEAGVHKEEGYRLPRLSEKFVLPEAEGAEQDGGAKGN